MRPPTDSLDTATRTPVAHVIAARNGSWTLKVTAEDGSTKAIHSLYDPEAESDNVVDAFQFDGRGIVVVLGLGLGYHVAGLLERFGSAEIIVVEAHRKIFDLQSSYGPRLSDKIECIVGLPADEALREISRLHLRSGMKPIAVFQVASAVAAFPRYYGQILSSLKRTMAVRLWDKLKYPKFEENGVNVGIIDFGYYLSHEVERAIRRLGHGVVKIPIKKGQEGEDAVRVLMESLIHCRPDFLLTINHLGFDKAGILTSFLKCIEMPAAVWYVDNPNLIVKTFDVNVSPYVSIFVWDSNYVKDMESMGFEEVVYLPLATDEEVFRPMDLSRSELKKSGTDVGFVGNSMVEPVRNWLERVPRGFHPLIEELAQVLSRTRQTVAQGLEISGNEARLDSLTEAEKLDFEGAVLWRATLLYRRSCVRKLAGFRHRIHGDEGWTQLLGNGYQVHPRLGYYSEVPKFYNACRINLNATNLQMGSAVNQRVFDVPACGAFILTDYQDSLTGLFEPEQECVFYTEPEEIPDMIRFYLKNPSAARAVTLKARCRVLKEHTYAHRLGRIIDHMQHRYGRVHG